MARGTFWSGEPQRWVSGLMAPSTKMVMTSMMPGATPIEETLNGYSDYSYMSRNKLRFGSELQIEFPNRLRYIVSCSV